MKRQPHSANPSDKTTHKTPVTAVASSTVIRQTKEAQLAAQEEALKQREAELIKLKAELERKEAQIALQTEEIARQEAALKQKADDVAKKEAKATQREAELTKRVTSLQQQAELLEQSQALYAKTKLECDQRVGEITEAVHTLNARAEELNLQTNALTHREGLVAEKEGLLTARERQLTARTHQATPRRPLYPITRALEAAVVPETVSQVSQSIGWFHTHHLLVLDQREKHFSYDKKQDKEIDRGISKVVYLNQVVDEMPLDAALSDQALMFSTILGNKNAEQDRLLCVKLTIALEVIRFVDLTGDYAPKPLNKGVLGMFSSAVEKSPTPEEFDRFKRFKESVLRAKNQESLDVALSAVEVSGDAATQFSPAYQRCLAKCEAYIMAYAVQRVPAGDFGF